MSDTLKEPVKKKRINPLLMKVIIVSVALHVIGAFIAGSCKFYDYIRKPPDFVPPEPTVNVDPPQRVTPINEPEKPKEQFKQKLTMPSVADISIDNLDMSLPNMDEGFTINTSTYRSGSILPGISGTDMGIGLPTVNIYDIETKAERVLVLIDANRRMVADNKGGLNSYKVIKNEVANVVKKLSPVMLFNVILFDRGNVLYFKPKLVSASADIHKELVDWIAPINADSMTIGLKRNNQTIPIELAVLPEEPIHKVLPNIQWDGNQVGLVTQLALEQNADAVFLLTGYHRGFEELRRPMNEAEAAEWEREVNSPSYQNKLSKHVGEVSKMKEKIRDTLVEINEQRASRGQPPRILKDPSNIYKSAEELSLDWKNPHPGDAPSFVIKPKEIEAYFEKVIAECYKQVQEPSVNVILFLAGNEQFSDDWEKQLNKYVRFFNGNKRIIRGANEIEKASSAP